MSDGLARAAATAALSVPAALLRQAAQAVVPVSRWSVGAEQSLLQASPATHYQLHAQAISQAWAAEPELPGTAVSAALQAASAAATAARGEHQASLVWTGPATEELAMRKTRAVLTGLVAGAQRSLLLVSYVSYNVDDLVRDLQKALDRGVSVTLVLETPDPEGGGLSVDPAKAFQSLHGAVQFYQWPDDQREVFHSTHARLHAKCVVADRSRALVTSANLTGAGINDNIELGTLIEAGPLPARLHRHFDLLIQAGTLVEVGV